MTDYISRQAAIDAIEAVFPVDPMKSEYAQGIACGAALAKTYIEQLPSAQPERKSGKWRHYEGYLTCSECRTEYDDDIMTHCCDDVPKFCPNCGADMRTAKQRIHDAIDNTPMAEDVYVGIKEKLHKAVDAVDELSSEGEE